MVSQADRIFRALLAAEYKQDWWGYNEISAVLQDLHGGDAPSRRTIQNRLHGLSDLGVLLDREVGQTTLYRVNPDYKE